METTPNIREAWSVINEYGTKGRLMPAKCCQVPVNRVFRRGTGAAGDGGGVKQPFPGGMLCTGAALSPMNCKITLMNDTPTIRPRYSRS